MKSKNVREEYSRKRKKDIKMHVEYELSAVMGTFSMRWGKTWHEASIIAIMHLLAVYMKSLSKLDPSPCLNIIFLNYSEKLIYP